MDLLELSLCGSKDSFYYIRAWLGENIKKSRGGPLLLMTKGCLYIMQYQQIHDDGRFSLHFIN